MWWLLLSGCVALCGADFEYQIKLAAPRDAEQAQKLLAMGVLLDRPRRNEAEVNGFVTKDVMEKLRVEKIAFREVAHEGRLGLVRDASVRRSERASQYHNYNELVALINDKVATYPNIIKKSVIGKSVNNLDLIAVEITNFANTQHKSQFKWVGNMHGDETVGREMLIKLIDDLCTKYAAGDAVVKQLVDNVDIWILPSMNPDGFERRQRGNFRNYDLNRNFPDQFGWTTGPPQPETTAVMAWSQASDFVLSANLHGGDLVANYPWDGNAQRRSGLYAASPDDLTFRMLATVYASKHAKMRASREFPGGITNGAEWYVLYGGMQDWNYLNTSNMEITLELSFDKYPPASTLDGYWADNREALYAYMSLVKDTGVRGRITGLASQEYKSLKLVVSRKKDDTFIVIDHIIHPTKDGYYHRLLAAGQYQLSVSCPAAGQCRTQTSSFEIPARQTTPVTLDFNMGQ